MPRPSSPFELIPVGARPQLPGHWVEEFSTYCWFYVSGLREIAHIAGTRNVQPIRDCRLHALHAVSDEWKRQVPNGDFSKFNPTQIQSAKQFDPLRFDKALLVVLALEEFARISIGQDFDIYQFVSIRPSLFQIDGLVDGGYALFQQEGLIDRLKQATNHTLNDDVAFKQIFQGRAAMEHYIDGVLAVAEENGIAIGQGKRVIIDRTDSQRLIGQKKPAENQIIIEQVDSIEPLFVRKRSDLRGAIIL